MSNQIDKLIAELVDDSMNDIKKLKKTELRQLVKDLLADNMRELTDDTIISIYEERYNTYIARV